MNKPLSVKVIQAIAIIQIGVVFLLLTYLIYAVNTSPVSGGVAFRFRAGVFDAMHMNPTTFGAYEFGYVFTGRIINVVLAGLILLFLGTRNLLGVKVVAGLQLLFGFSAGGLPIVPLILVILSFLGSTKSYFAGDFEEKDQKIETV